MRAIMKSLVLSQFMAFFMFALDSSETSAAAIGRSSTGNSSDRKIIEPRPFCLEPPNDLPPCEFATEDDEYVEDPSEERRLLRRARSLIRLEDTSAKNNNGNRPIVFKIQRCIPPGILSRFPLCDEETLIDSKGERSSFLPFKVIDNPNENFEAPLEFPQFNMDDWRRNVNIPWTSLVNNKDDFEKKNAEVTEDTDGGSNVNRRPIVIRVRREIKDILKSMGEGNIFRKFSSWASGKEAEIRTNIQTRSRKSTLKHDRPTSDDNSGNFNDEFLYEKAVPYDPEIFNMARHGSEFPYAQAIPYDAKKLEERKNGGLKRSFDSASRQSTSVDEKKSNNSRDISFDVTTLAANKQEIDRAKTLGDVESSSSEGPEGTRESTKNSEISERVSETENISVHKENDEGGSRTRNEWEVSLQIPRVVKETSETSTLASSTSKHYEIPKKWSEFPYSKAIPFDPSKFRHPRSIDQRNSLITIPYDFPYARAIPYDPWKLSAIGMKENHSNYERSSTNERSGLSMA